MGDGHGDEGEVVDEKETAKESEMEMKAKLYMREG